MNVTENNLIAAILQEKIMAMETNEKWEEGGIVISVDESVAKVKGLTGVSLQQEVVFENGTLGLVYDIVEYYVSVLILKEDINNKVTVDTFVRKTNKIFSVPVGNFSGRVIDALGNPLDGLGELPEEGHRIVDIEPLSIIERQSVQQPLYTGITLIDSIIPLGRGQRSIIIGDRKTGKTTIASDTIANQAQFFKTDKEVYCIYVSIGQKQQDTKRVVEELKNRGAMDYTTVVLSGSSENSATLYITPYVATALAEHMCFKMKKDVFIVYDDLSKHAVSYRTIDLILRRPPGRECYPGGVFYLHSRLLERSGAFRSGNSITSFSVLETQAGNSESYISTNAISITDGQLFLDTELFHRGVKPAINIGKSVSRIGSAAQEGLLKEESKQLKLGLMRYEEFLAYTKIIQDLDVSVQNILKKGELLTSIIKQDAGENRSPAENAIIITLADTDLLDNMKDVQQTILNLFNYFLQNEADLVKNIVTCIFKDCKKYKEIILERVRQNTHLIV